MEGEIATTCLSVAKGCLDGGGERNIMEAPSKEITFIAAFKGRVVGVNGYPHEVWVCGGGERKK